MLKKIVLTLFFTNLALAQDQTINQDQINIFCMAKQGLSEHKTACLIVGSGLILGFVGRRNLPVTRNYFDCVTKKYAQEAQLGIERIRSDITGLKASIYTQINLLTRNSKDSEQRILEELGKLSSKIDEQNKILQELKVFLNKIK